MDQILATNLKSVFLVTNALLPYFLQQKKGVIVNMASIAGLVAGGRRRSVHCLQTRNHRVYKQLPTIMPN